MFNPSMCERIKHKLLKKTIRLCTYKKKAFK